MFELVLYRFSVRGRTLRRVLGPQVEVGAQPVQRLFAQSDVPLVVELVGVLPFAGSGKSGVARCAVAAGGLKVVGQFRIVGESVGVEAGCRPVHLFEVTYLGQGEALKVVPRLELPCLQLGQLLLQGSLLFGPANQLCRRVPPIRSFLPQLVSAAVSDESLCEVALAPENIAQVTMRFGKARL